MEEEEEAVNCNSETSFQTSSICITTINSSLLSQRNAELETPQGQNKENMPDGTSDFVSPAPFPTESAEETSLMSCSNTGLETPHGQNQDSLPDGGYSDFITPGRFPSGRVICDVNHIVIQSRNIEKHTTGCNFGGSMIFERATRCGLIYTYYYTCSHKLCGHKEKIVTDKDKSLNNLAVLGAMATGNGFSQEEQKFSIMDMTYMTKKTYASCEKISGQVVQAFAAETMEASINEEKRLAELRGDRDEDGYYNICVIVDGGWCKRSYGHGYNASSGVSVLIGEQTKKILFLNSRNKASSASSSCPSDNAGHQM